MLGRKEPGGCGMETLLRAPIQVQLQQPEGLEMEPTYEKKYGNDQTVIFSDENQMDLTASHTVMITKDLLNCPEIGKSSKIDTRSFLANLKSHTEDVTKNKEFNLSTDSDKCSFQSKTSISSEDKVNFNDFIKRLKLEKSMSSYTEGPDKENVFIAHIPSKEPNNDAFSLLKYVFPTTEKNSHCVTKLFREQGDGKYITQCHTDNIQSLDSIQGDKTIFFSNNDDAMEMTKSLTPKRDDKSVYISNLTQIYSNPENAISGPMDKTVCSEEVDMDITKSNTVAIHDQIIELCPTNVQVLSLPNLENKLLFQDQETVSEDIKQNTNCNSVYVTRTQLQQDLTNPLNVSLCGNKTVVFSGEDMDLTKCFTVKIDNSNLETQLPPTSANVLASVKTKNPLSPSNEPLSGLETWGKWI
ncbi:kinetochore scaffold 1-like [Antechinus flavipes]|uniref:kinetochore scaffold 1-like n=1 Tax=Antechinus flavipes TaxID=38775 RepID=UPI0022358B17|nr:kinetochore scaffold 1-like [Antechinus flavipes]